MDLDAHQASGSVNICFVNKNLFFDHKMTGYITKQTIYFSSTFLLLCRAACRAPPFGPLAQQTDNLTLPLGGTRATTRSPAARTTMFWCWAASSSQPGGVRESVLVPLVGQVRSGASQRAERTGRE